MLLKLKRPSRWLPSSDIPLKKSGLKKYVMVGLVIVSVCLVVGALVLSNLAKNPKTYYKKQLKLLSETVSAIGPATSLEGGPVTDVSGNIKRYDTLMYQIIDLCRPLITRDKEFRGRTQDKKTLGTIDNSKKLCTDLIDVATYSQSVYRISKDYIGLNTEWPVVDSREYNGRLIEVSGIVQKTKNGLKEIDSSKVNDPGLEELISHPTEADAKIVAINASLSDQDYSSAQNHSGQLVKMLSDDKIHFLSARSYFWHNTVQLEDLQKAIDQL